ncbi:MAG: TonB-dependent receptor [Sphingomonadales bacterium]
MTARRAFSSILLATTMLAGAPASAQTPAPADTDDEIIVTAQKREESLQNVPISIQAIGTKKLDQLNVASFNDYAALLPSVSFQAGTPGATQVYMRGIASGGDGNHSGSLPAVGIYLDEQPVTTIDGALDVHIYDIARIESLSGPQGTLYGASSEAGTIRIITNKPSTAGFEGRVDGEVNIVNKGGVGGKLEGMVNLPLSEKAAVRIVGWYQHEAGYIDNVPGSRSFIIPTGTVLAPGYTGTVTNAGQVGSDINRVDVAGGRAALKLDFDENWTATATVIGQEMRTKGRFSVDNRLGDLQVQTFFPESSRDRFIQGALTIQGKVGNWDLTYAGAYLDRKTHAESDYTDYAEAYDALYASSGGLAGYQSFVNNAGQTIDPRQRIIGDDHFTKISQELRVASPVENRFRVVAGLFFQRQTHLIKQDYQVANLATSQSVPGYPGTLWLTLQDRVDRDYAMFGEASFDILPTLTFTAGGRAYIYDNTLEGFNGFGSPNPTGGSSGVGRCFRDAGGNLVAPTVAGGPCPNIGTQLLTASGAKTTTILPASATGQGFTHKLNLTWKPNSDLLFYGTWSRGFRPGGINRRPGLPPYGADFLTNYEVGFKTTWLGGKLRFNGAVYQQEWKQFQFSFLGLNSLTQIQNGPDARIKGVEADVNYTPVTGLNLTVTGAYTDAKTITGLCVAASPLPDCGGPANTQAPIGTRLPITPQFKVSGNARYTWEMGSLSPFIQGLVSHQSGASTDLRVIEAGQLGPLPAFTSGNISAGAMIGSISAELYVENVTDERGQLSRSVRCSICYQRNYSALITPRTIGFRLGAKF